MEQQPPTNRLAATMKERGVSRLELCAFLGVSEDTVRRMEKPTGSILQHVVVLSEFFDVTTDHLLGLDRESTSTSRAAA